MRYFQVSWLIAVATALALGAAGVMLTIPEVKRGNVHHVGQASAPAHVGDPESRLPPHYANPAPQDDMTKLRAWWHNGERLQNILPQMRL